MKPLRLPRLGLRREVLLLLPMAMLALVLLSAFSLVTYRNGIESLRQERRREAVDLARRAAAELAAAPTVTSAELLRAAPGTRRAALVADGGRVLARFGPFDAADPLAPLGETAAGGPLPRAVAVGPDESVSDAVAGFAPLRRGSRDLALRVDLPADSLAGQLRGLRILTRVALPLNFLVVALVFFFLRYMLRPFDTLLEQARRLDAQGPEREDEIAFLVGTFERAVAALARRDLSAEDDIASLQRTLAPSLESGLLLLDRQAKVLALNPVGRELLALDETAEGVPLAEALAGHPALLEILERAVETRQGATRREADVVVGGERRRLGLTVHALRRDDGSVGGFLVLFVDLTEARRRAEEERLAEGLEQLGELAAGVAHELRNGLATLSGYLTLVERQSDEQSLRDYLAEMRRESDHLARVAADFLTFARPEAARVEEVDLLALLRRAAADPALGPGAVSVAESPSLEARIKGDPELLERAVRNLLFNAVEAERPSGGEAQVVCRLRRAGDVLEVAIEDRGPGLPEAVRERLFQPFVTGRPDGVGLGLSLAHRIVSLHGGKLRIEDRSQGGTRATISFPSDVFVT